MADRRAEYRFRNNGVWDRLFFSITENCIISGWNQKDVDYGSYRVLPGGWVIFEVWAYLHFNGVVESVREVTLPLTFSKEPAVIAGSMYQNSTGAWGYMINVSAKVKNNSTIYLGGYHVKGTVITDVLSARIIGFGRI